MVRLTIRATDDALPPLLLKMMQERIAKGVSTAVQERYVPPTVSEISDSFRNVMVTTSNR
jgi:AP-2 complex subunit alpha